MFMALVVGRMFFVDAPFAVATPACAWHLAHVELENARYQNDGPGLTTRLEHRELNGFGAIKENAATKMLLISNDPVAATVLTEQESRGSGIRIR
jgi:hypothetical protein